jgi:predicted RNA-binding Zn ribbon-like protein
MSNPAPGALEIVRSFVNSRDIDHDVEELSGPLELVSWLGDQGMLGTDKPDDIHATPTDLRRAIELREALRAQLRAHHGEPDDPAAVAVLDATAIRARLTLRFVAPEETVLEPQAGGVDGALGRLLAIVKAAIDDGSWARLKVCVADTCQWAFFDASRNRSAVWCDMRVCGNRAKVREFRQRTRAGHGDAEAPAGDSD